MVWSDRSLLVDPFSYFSFQPELDDHGPYKILMPLKLERIAHEMTGTDFLSYYSNDP